MKRICAWCRQGMGSVEGTMLPDTEISHGICSSCRDNFEFQMGVPLQKYLDSLPLPVLAVDRSVVVKASNARACHALGKDPREVIQHRGGNVFECSHARLPEGCGGTVHCSGCAIRRSVERTYETGEPQIRVPAVLKREGPGSVSDVALIITTVKSGEVVLLQVEDLEASAA
jgi:hypothetical protein